MKKSEKEPNTLSASTPPVRLYRDQLEELVGIFTEAGLEVKISQGDYIFEDLDDLKENRGSVITDLVVSGSEEAELGTRSIDVTFAKGHSPRLFLWHYTKELEICWHRLLSKLNEQKDPRYSAFNPWIGWAIFLLLFWAIFPIQRAPEGVVRLYYFALASSLCYWVYSIYRRSSFPALVLDRAHEATSFWKRNKDKLILLVLGAIIGSMITFILKPLLSGKNSGADQPATAVDSKIEGDDKPDTESEAPSQ